MSAQHHLSLSEALASLRQDPTHPVEAEVDGMLVELRAKPHRSAADVFDSIGPWQGESTEELLTILEQSRRSGGSRPPPSL